MLKRLTWLTAALLLLSLALVGCAGDEGLSLDDAKSTVDAVTENLNEQIDGLEKEIEDKDGEIADLEDDKDALADEVKDLEDKVDDLEDDVASAPEPTEAPPEPTEEPTTGGGGGGDITLDPIEGVTYSGDKKTVRWFVGLGTGGNEDQRAVQEAVVEAFNDANPDVELVLEIVDNAVAPDTLSTYIAAGNAPDIVGPVGIAGSNRYAGNWLDMDPIIDEMGYNLGQFLPESVDFYRVDGELIGLPFAEFPTMMFYNVELFDEAGLDYPPQEFGAEYNGETWDFDAVRDLSMLLTIDGDGNDATSGDFDADSTEQWGFVHQWAADIRAVAQTWGAADMFDADGNAVIPDSYREAVDWTYAAIWDDQFHPDAEEQASDLLATPNAFASGNVAMALTHQWFTCCLGDADFDWGIGVVPEVDGNFTSKLHADTFRMMDYGQDDDQAMAAFSALSFIVGEASDDLLQVYGGMPARPSETASFFEGLDETYPFDVNWQVSLDSLAYNDNPSHEGNMPNFAESSQVASNFWSLLQSDGELDIDAEFDQFEEDLNEAFDGETITVTPTEPQGLTPISGVTYEGDKQEIRWFVGLGTGGNEDQRAVQEAVVEAFNDANPDVELILEIVDNAVAPDTLSTYIAAGNAPDIVGPVGIAGSNRYAGNWLDMDPVIDEMGYDLGQFLPESVDFYRVDGELIGLPFAEFPTMMFYNVELFDEAGIDYPPQEFGAEYNGETWDFDAVRDLSMLLTIDGDGNDATSGDFDADSTEQWGFVHQWAADIRAVAQTWGAADMFDADGNAVIPDSYREAVDWTYAAIWDDQFHPDAEEQASDLLATPNAFASGNVAMALTHQWFTCCLGDADFEWGIGIVPEVDGTYTSKLHADTFRMMDYGQSDEKVQAAFSALSYIVGEASDDLLQVYGGMPARPAETEAFFDGLDETYPFDVNWQVSLDSLAYNDNPSHEGNMPNFAESSQVASNFWSLLQSDGELDIDDEFDELESDLNEAFSGADMSDIESGGDDDDSSAGAGAAAGAGGALAAISGVTYEGDKKTVRWFVGLGTGGNEDQRAVQEAVVEAFNDANPDVELILEIVDNAVAPDTLSTYIAAGNAPDIVGPVGIAGSNRYAGNWLDMDPIIGEMGYDLGQFLPESVDFYRVDGELIGLPFAEFPTMVFYNTELFDEAGLDYPPQEFGAEYDGETWDFDAVRDLAMLLTIDGDGNDATSGDFDADSTEQWGFVHQWAADIRAVGQTWGAADLFDADGNAVIPDSYREAVDWTYAAIWDDQFYPDAEESTSDLLATPNEFASGNVAMALTHQWFTCCLGDADFEWGIGVVPEVDGNFTSKLHADTFRMMDYGQDDDQAMAAFSALSFIVGEASDDLLQVYGGMPARPSETASFFEGLDETYPFDVNWQVSLDSLAYNDNPSHEGNMPNFAESSQVASNFWSLLQSDGDLDIDDAFDDLEADLNEAFSGADMSGMDGGDEGGDMALAPISEVTYDGEDRVVRWFVGLGTGGDPAQKAVQEQVVEAFNEANPNVTLELEIVQNEVAGDTLSTYIAAGNPPDIVGPVGIAGSNRYAGNWLDLDPVIEDMGYDLGQFIPEAVDFYRVDGELIGLPFAEFPSMVFYNRELFDEAGVDYPPQEFGADYADGDTWDFDKVREIAMLMTIDESGEDATSDDFDPDSVEQWGFIHQWSGDVRATAQSWGAADLVDADGNAMLPDSYVEALTWSYDAIWADNFYPSAAYQESDLLSTPNAFASGNIAMGLTHQWFTCCLGDADFEWDVAIVPSVDGEYTSKLHADTFRMLDYGQDDEQTQAAFAALSYIVGSASDDLLQVYGGMPARPSETAGFFEGLDETYPFDVNWDVPLASLAYNDNPSHEGNMPNYPESNQVATNFWSLLQSDGELDLDEAFAEFMDDMQEALE